MPELSTDLIALLGLLVLVVVVASPRAYPGLTDSAPETLPGDPGPASETASDVAPPA